MSEINDVLIASYTRDGLERRSAARCTCGHPASGHHLDNLHCSGVSPETGMPCNCPWFNLQPDRRAVAQQVAA